MIRSVAGVLIRNGLVLLARRKPGGDMGGRWELPGGKCEGSESPAAALRREFDEEFGVAVSVGEACAEAFFRHNGKDHLVKAFFIETAGSFTTLLEHDEVAWFPIDGLPARSSLVDFDADLLNALAGHPALFRHQA
jgi:8-oxo-dGTP diphosphatase